MHTFSGQLVYHHNSSQVCSKRPIWFVSNHLTLYNVDGIWTKLSQIISHSEKTHHNNFWKLVLSNIIIVRKCVEKGEIWNLCCIVQNVWCYYFRIRIILSDFHNLLFDVLKFIFLYNENQFYMLLKSTWYNTCNRIVFKPIVMYVH